VFEQSYAEVEGDSASLAELCALLSSLSDLSALQSLAVTGSVNQLGRIQPIGGVNEKVEGFFDVCKATGLTGHQGVIIPKANIPHLMLREDVVAAAAAGQFHIFAVTSVDEALALLLNTAAGDRDDAGEYSPPEPLTIGLSGNSGSGPLSRPR
jgi:predicted ATP-dependent protease